MKSMTLLISVDRSNQVSKEKAAGKIRIYLS